MESTVESTARNHRNEKAASDSTLSLLTSLPEATQFPFLLFLCIHLLFSPLQISVSADSLAHLEKVPGLISIGPDLVT